jgi:hypothetical protein
MRNGVVVVCAEGELAWTASPNDLVTIPDGESISRYLKAMWHERQSQCPATLKHKSRGWTYHPICLVERDGTVRPASSDPGMSEEDGVLQRHSRYDLVVHDERLAEASKAWRVRQTHLVCFLFTEIAGHVDGPSDCVQSVNDGGHQASRSASECVVEGCQMKLY